MSFSEISQIVAENSQAGRILFLELEFSPKGIVATRGVGATGRAKPGAMRSGAGYLQFEVFSPTGERTLTGSIEDPLHQRLEYEDETQPGRLRAKIVDRASGSISLRLPGEANAARVVFFRTGSSGRESAGEIVLR